MAHDPAGPGGSPRDEETTSFDVMTKALRFSTVHRAILEQMNEGVYLVDRRRTIAYWNEGARRISGFSAFETVGSRCFDNLLMHIDDAGASLCQGGCPLAKTMEDGVPREAEVYLHHKSGHRVPVLVRTAPIRDESGEIIGGAEVFGDNTGQSAMRDELVSLRQLALNDPLTEIGNRRYLDMVLAARHNEFKRYGWRFGVLMFDVDHFKSFNDRHGHDIGDRVLKMVSRTLASNVRSFDTVGRWGGEEFLMIIARIEEERLRSIAEKLRRLIEGSGLIVGNDTLRVTASIGGSVSRPNEGIEGLVKRADDLLYRSKAGGRNRSTIA